MAWDTAVRFRADGDVAMRLYAQAAIQGVTRSELLRQAMERHVAWLELPEWKRKARDVREGESA